MGRMVSKLLSAYRAHNRK